MEVPMGTSILAGCLRAQNIALFGVVTNKEKEKLMKMNVGLIGTGFMGKAHVFGFATARRVFDLPVDFHM